jgi:hypothetical protein
VRQTANVPCHVKSLSILQMNYGKFELQSLRMCPIPLHIDAGFFALLACSRAMNTASA